MEQARLSWETPNNLSVFCQKIVATKMLKRSSQLNHEKDIRKQEMKNLYM